MTEDLITRLTVAIDERERLAREATPGPWTVDPMFKDTAVVEPNVALWLDFASDGSADALHKPDAEHIAANSPDVVLRGCAADRRVLARHQAKTGCRNLHGDDPHDAGCYDCAYCDTAYWPCPDLRDLAERLGVATEPCGP